MDLIFSIYTSTFVISGTSSKVKVKGRGHKGQKCEILIFSLVLENKVKVMGSRSKVKRTRSQCLMRSKVNIPRSMSKVMRSRSKDKVTRSTIFPWRDYL